MDNATIIAAPIHISNQTQRFMKRGLLLSLLAPMAVVLWAQSAMGELDGVKIINSAIGHKISHSGVWVIAETYMGGTVVYNTQTGADPVYYTADYGQGYVVSDNGWIVGLELVDDEFNHPIIMADGKQWTPDVFKNQTSGSLHSITPDGSRVCGMVGGGNTYRNLPFYCDIDANGNFGEIQILPFPDTDFFGSRPQYCSATWMSEDGKTIAGQMIDARGAFVSPIVYKEQSDGSWSYSLPSANMFNPNGLPIPAPFGDIDDEYPDAPYPELQNFMTPAQYQKWEEALLEWELHNFAAAYDPYSRLDEFMSLENVQKYYDAIDKYNAAVEEYNEKNFAYWDELYEIADESLFFIRNAMSLSADGKWLASSAQVEDMSDPDNITGKYVPYLCNLETGQWVKCGDSNLSLLTNQILPGGTVICNNPANDNLPQISYVYIRSSKTLMSLYDFVNNDDPTLGKWYRDNLTADDLIVGEDETGGLITEKNVVITGSAAFSEDMSVLIAGVSGYELGIQDYFTYIIQDFEAGVESLVAAPSDGVYRVYNLQGVKVLETKNAQEVGNLGKGIYIVNGKKVML